jgi:serine/threonine protein kinase
MPRFTGKGTRHKGGGLFGSNRTELMMAAYDGDLIRAKNAINNFENEIKTHPQRFTHSGGSIPSDTGGYVKTKSVGGHDALYFATHSGPNRSCVTEPTVDRKTIIDNLLSYYSPGESTEACDFKPQVPLPQDPLPQVPLPQVPVPQVPEQVAPVQVAPIQKAPVQVAPLPQVHVQKAPQHAIRFAFEAPKLGDRGVWTPVNPARVKPARVEPARVEPARVKLARVEPARVEPARVEPARVEPARVELARVEPARAEPARAEPNIREDPWNKPLAKSVVKSVVGNTMYWGDRAFVDSLISAANQPSVKSMGRGTFGEGLRVSYAGQMYLVKRSHAGVKLLKEWFEEEADASNLFQSEIPEYVTQLKGARWDPRSTHDYIIYDFLNGNTLGGYLQILRQQPMDEKRYRTNLSYLWAAVEKSNLALINIGWSHTDIKEDNLFMNVQNLSGQPNLDWSTARCWLIDFGGSKRFNERLDTHCKVYSPHCNYIRGTIKFPNAGAAYSPRNVRLGPGKGQFKLTPGMGKYAENVYRYAQLSPEHNATSRDILWKALFMEIFPELNQPKYSSPIYSEVLFGPNDREALVRSETSFRWIRTNHGFVHNWCKSATGNTLMVQKLPFLQKFNSETKKEYYVNQITGVKEPKLPPGETMSVWDLKKDNKGVWFVDITTGEYVRELPTGCMVNTWISEKDGKDTWYVDQKNNTSRRVLADSEKNKAWVRKQDEQTHWYVNYITYESKWRLTDNEVKDFWVRRTDGKKTWYYNVLTQTSWEESKKGGSRKKVRKSRNRKTRRAN